MAEPKKDKLMVYELLSFVQNQLDVMDELCLEHICTYHYTDDEITAAKTVLQEKAKTSARLVTHRNKKKGLQDIFRVFKKTNPDDIPSYVAHEFHKFPSTTWMFLAYLRTKA